MEQKGMQDTAQKGVMWRAESEIGREGNTGIQGAEE